MFNSVQLAAVQCSRALNDAGNRLVCGSRAGLKLDIHFKKALSLLRLFANEEVNEEGERDANEKNDNEEVNEKDGNHRAFDLAQIRGGPNPGFGPAMDLGHPWLIEVRGLANRSEGLANRSEGLGVRLAGPRR